MGSTRVISLLCAVISLLQLSGAGTVSLPSYPLAVKNPYLSTWVPGDQSENAPTAQPQFWTGQPLNWTILARVNGDTYTLFGAPNGIAGAKAASQSSGSVSYTSSHTLINLTAGAAKITLDFFSPVLPEAQDYARQSLPYSYLTVTASSTVANKALQVQILSAIDQSWTAQNGASKLSYTQYGNAGLYTFNNPNAIPFTELNDMATWGSVVFATPQGRQVSHACNTAAAIYQSFTSKGYLSASSSCGNTNLAAFASNLGWFRSGSSVTFAVGHDRVDTINYLNNTQTGYYRSQWSTIPEAVNYFLQDYNSSLTQSKTFDAKVRSKAQAVSSSFGSAYADIIEASVRQTFGALELTVPIDDLTAEPQAFLKEISSDGNVNTVDVIFPTFPIFISLNPEYIRLLLQPILTYLELPPSDGWPLPYVIHDIGSSYPNATGHNDGVAEQMPLFETSSLFILMYSYQKFSGNTQWASQYSSLLKGYATYLVNNTLYPASQLISVDAIVPTANQTGLAVQSTIGLKAASTLTGDQSYGSTAANFSTALYNNGLGLNGASPAHSTHFTYNYHNSSSWGVLFASYPDVLLDLQTFPDEAWSLMSQFYLGKIKKEGLPFAGPITYNYTGSGPVNWGITDWNFWASATSSTTLQAAVVDSTHAFLTNGENTEPFGTKYYVEGPDTGLWLANRARSTVGANFALLALEQGVWGSLY